MTTNQKVAQVRVLPSALPKVLRIGPNLKATSLHRATETDCLKKGRKLLNYLIEGYPMVRILLLRPKFYKSIRFHISFRSAYFPCPNRQVQIKYTCCTDEEGNHWKKTRGMGRTTFPIP